MRLSVDKTGLRYEIDVPDTTIGKDVAESITRGDVTGSSFAFIPTKVEWTRDDKRRVDVRTIMDLDLIDTGPVTYPAYDGTTTGMRSDVKTARDKWVMEREAVLVRMRLIEINA